MGGDHRGVRPVGDERRNAADVDPQAAVDAGEAPGVSSESAAQIRELKPSWFDACPPQAMWASASTRSGSRRQRRSHEPSTLTRDRNPHLRDRHHPGGRVDRAATIPDALTTLTAQLTTQLCPTARSAGASPIPAAPGNRGYGTLNGRLELVTTAVNELADESLYTRLHRAADRATGRQGDRQALIEGIAQRTCKATVNTPLSSSLLVGPLSRRDSLIKLHGLRRCW